MANKAVLVLNKSDVRGMEICVTRHIIDVKDYKGMDAVKAEYYEKFEQLVGDEFYVFDTMRELKQFVKENTICKL
jgi:hypothetical protein